MKQSVPISEREIQKTVVQFIRTKYPDVIIIMSPIHKTSIQQGVLNKALGYTKGTPDLFLPVTNDCAAGLFIELKTLKGELSPEQTAVLNKLKNQGYHAHVCKTIDDAILVIDAYMEMPDDL